MPPLNATSPFRLRTLGALALVDPAGAPVALRRKELLLLAHLASRPDGAAGRAELAALLWGESDDRLARVSLRQALFRLRAALGDGITTEGETVALAPASLWCDAAELPRLASAGALRDAVALWAGDFLGGDDPPGSGALREWAAGERSRLRLTYRRALERLVEQDGAAGRWADAADAAERWAALEPLDADATARLAHARRRAGDPAAALARIDALEVRRRDELGSGLPPRLTALREELRAELAARDAEAARAALRRPPALTTAPELVGRGTELAALLAAWRHAGDGADPVLVTGARAQGRTRLLDELLTVARAEGALALFARGYEVDRAAPWATARALLAPLADAPGLAGLAPPVLARLAALVPAVRDAFPALPEAAAADEWALLDAARLAILEAAVETPVVVVVDDLPVADPMTRQLVLALARRLPVPNVLLVAAAHDGALAAMPEAPALLDVPALHRVPLAPLAVDDAARLVGSMLPVDDATRRALAARVHADAAGAPGAMVAAVEALVAAGAVARHPDGAWRLTLPAASAPAPPDARAPAGAPAALPAPRRARRARALALVGGAALALALVAALALRRDAPGAAALDGSLVAVAPFDVADSSLALWREGIVDVLARQLDGAGPLRSVSPTVVVRRFEGRGDLASARTLGERAGAGLVVYGGVVRAGGDSVRVEATLYDLVAGRAVTDVRVSEAAGRMDRALDSLSVGLLRELARTRPLGAVRATGVSSASLPALKAFLAAEQHYRAGAYDSAVAAADRAVRLDSGFALARHRLGTLQLFGTDQEGGARHLLRAARDARGLSPRDSIVLALDSLRAAGSLAAERRRAVGGVPTAFMEAYLRRLRQGTLLYPDDPEIWYTYAEALTRVGAVERTSRDAQIEAYERAIALDSAFLPTYVQAVGALLAVDDVARARHHLRTVRALARGARLRSAADLVLRVVGDDARADTVALEAGLVGLAPSAVEPLAVMLEDWPDSTAAMLHLVRYAERAAAPLLPEMVDGFLRPLHAATLDYRGRLAASRAVRASPEQVVAHALLGALPPDSARAAVGAWLAADLPALARPLPLAWLAERGDTAALHAYAARVDRLAARPADEDLARRARHGAQLARAYVRLARRDTAGALAALERLAPRDCLVECLANDLLRARLLVAARRVDAARALLAGGSPAEGEAMPSALDVMWQLERARLAERAGDARRAATAYAIVAGTWARADAPLQPWVREARAGVARARARAAATGER